MARSLALLAPLFLSFVNAQSPAARADVYPMMKTWKCTKAGGCKEQTTALVMDSSAHSVHQVNNPRAGCGDWGAGPNATVCPDKATCQKNCVMEAITDYSQRGITVKDDVLNMRQLRPDGNVVSPRVYLLSQDKSKYEMLNLAGGEFTFDVDVSKLPCGMNGALYLSEMEADGGRSKEPLNTGGSAWGTGYCDAQCFTTPFINGVVRVSSLYFSFNSV
jgi:cellulase